MPFAIRPTHRRTSFPIRAAFLVCAAGPVVLLAAATATGAADVPWGTAQTLDASAQDLSVLVAVDLDQDGIEDLVGAGPSGLAWWPGGTGGTGIDASADDLVELAVADLDGDGDLDLVGASPTDGLLWWQNTAGNASAWTGSTVDTVDARDVAVADADHDGDLDLVVALGGASGSVEWWQNTAGNASAWSRSAIDAAYPHASSVAVADLDHDGTLDVAASAGGTADRIDWWRGNGGGSWTEHGVATGLADPHGVSVGDLDGDGDLDLAAAEDGGLGWWLSDGSPSDGGWVTGTLAAGSPTALRLGDVNGDGTPDLVACAGNDILWWDNPGDGASWTARTGPSAEGIRVAVPFDLDGDGDGDLAAASHGDDDLLAWSNETLHRSADFRREQTLDGAFDGARSVHAADLDGDGDLDVAGAAYEQGELTWWENTGDDPSSWPRRIVEAGLPYAFAVRAADLDRDGDLDLVAAFSRLTFEIGTNRLYWWRNDGADSLQGGLTWTRFTVSTPFGASDVWPVDMDRDGDLDLLSAAAGSDEIAWHKNDGSGGGWSTTVIDTTFDRVHSVVAADIDGDGDPDVVAAGDTADEVAWWENVNGDGSLPFTKHSIVTGWDGAYDTWVADLDGDGDLDVLAASQFDDRISWWQNTDGQGTFGSENTLGNPFDASEGFFNQAYSVETADMDGDGTLDVVGAAFKDGGQMAWWSNIHGDGSQWLKHDVTLTYDGAGTVHVADVNGDGLPDLLTTAEVDDQITFWPNGGGQFALATASIAPAEPAPGVAYGLFSIEMTHRGLVGEGDIELASIEVRLQDSSDVVLNDVQANGLIERLRVLRDNDIVGVPGIPDVLDPEIALLETLALDAEGRLEIPVPDGATEAAVSVGSPARFFLIMETTADSDQQGVSGLRITHLTSASTRAEDRDHDIPLLLEHADDVDTGVMAFADVADLQLTLVSSADPVTAGDPLTWTATVTNLGPDPAADVILSFQLPVGVTFDATSGCDQDPDGTAACDVGALALSASAQVTVTVDVDPDASGSVELLAAAGSTTVDPQSANDGASSSVDVIAVADLAIAVQAPPIYNAGGTLDYRLEITSAGPGPAGAVVAGPLPAEVDSAAWTCQAFDGATCGSASGSGAVDDTPTLPDGGRVVYEIEAQISATATGALSLTGQVSAGSGAQDPQAGNDTATATTHEDDDSLFYDGFESGGTGSWSAVVTLTGEGRD